MALARRDVIRQIEATCIHHTILRYGAVVVLNSEIPHSGRYLHSGTPSAISLEYAL